jgi:transposase
MPRLCGYAKKGERCFGKRDWQARGRINVIGALYNQALLTTCLFECNIDGDIFHQWVCEDLLPKLSEGTVVIMDNATFHKRQDTQQLLEKAGMVLEYLPVYSPDLNPIEQKWAQAKAIRRRERCSTYDLFSRYLL